MTQAVEAKAEKELQNRLRQLDDLLQQVQAIADPAAQATTAKIIQALMEFHGAGINRLLQRLADSGDGGAALIDSLAEDDLVSTLLLVYNLHPHDLDTRVCAALEKARPYLASHGGNVELLGITDEGVVHLRMQGSCHGCPSSAVTLKQNIEQAIYDKAPDVSAIQVEGEDKPAESPLDVSPTEEMPLHEIIGSNGKRHLQLQLLRN